MAKDLVAGSTEAAETAGSIPTCRVTVVHGTWARNARWTQPDSRLLQALVARLGGGVSVDRFGWSGGNSHAARSEASRALAARLETELGAVAPLPHYLICHSHGGSVAMGALGRLAPDLRERISGVVCMATPFLVARKRDLGMDPVKLMTGALVALLFAALLIFTLVTSESIGSPAGIGFLVVATIVVMAPLVFLHRWLGYADRLLDELAAPRIPADRLLIIRSPGDEASAALAFFQFISQITVRFYVLALGVFAGFEALAERWSARRLLMLLFAAVALGLSVLLGSGLVALLGTSGVAFVFSIAVMLVGVFAAVHLLFIASGNTELATVFFRLLVAILTWPLIGFLSLLLLPVGRDLAVANILLDVTVESTPLGTWTVHQVDPLTSRELEGAVPLMHGVYENPRAVHLIVDWIASRSLSATGKGT